MKYTLEKEGRFKGRWKSEDGYFFRVKPADAEDEPVVKEKKAKAKKKK
jgi:hypothetical protein